MKSQLPWGQFEFKKKIDEFKDFLNANFSKNTSESVLDICDHLDQIYNKLLMNQITDEQFFELIVFSKSISNQFNKQVDTIDQQNPSSQDASKNFINIYCYSLYQFMIHLINKSLNENDLKAKIKLLRNALWAQETLLENQKFCQDASKALTFQTNNFFTYLIKALIQQFVFEIAVNKQDDNDMSNLSHNAGEKFKIASKILNEEPALAFLKNATSSSGETLQNFLQKHTHRCYVESYHLIQKYHVVWYQDRFEDNHCGKLIYSLKQIQSSQKELQKLDPDYAHSDKFQCLLELNEIIEFNKHYQQQEQAPDFKDLPQSIGQYITSIQPQNLGSSEEIDKKLQDFKNSKAQEKFDQLKQKLEQMVQNQKNKVEQIKQKKDKVYQDFQINFYLKEQQPKPQQNQLPTQIKQMFDKFQSQGNFFNQGGFNCLQAKSQELGNLIQVQNQVINEYWQKISQEEFQDQQFRQMYGQRYAASPSIQINMGYKDLLNSIFNNLEQNQLSQQAYMIDQQTMQNLQNYSQFFLTTGANEQSLIDYIKSDNSQNVNANLSQNLVDIDKKIENQTQKISEIQQQLDQSISTKQLWRMSQMDGGLPQNFESLLNDQNSLVLILFRLLQPKMIYIKFRLF